MKKVSFSIRYSLLGLSSLLLACQPNAKDSASVNVNINDKGSGETAAFYAKDEHPEKNDGTREKLGSFFLVEHFDTSVSPDMQRAILSHTPGGIVFWNPKKVGGIQLRETIRSYSYLAKKNGKSPILFSTDYEGGGLAQSLDGRSVPGVQRFQKDLTLLAHPSWLGASQETFGQELCRLHGSIMSKEMKSIGINYPLATVSDLGFGLFKIRSVSKDPKQVSECMNEVLNEFAKTQNVILVTKHFPGLGSTVGDTHDGVVRSRAQSLDEMNSHAYPFKKIFDKANNENISPLLSVLAGHAVYPQWDSKNTTTESKIILTQKAKNEFNFQGVLLSDAMWMGEYGKLRGAPLMRVYLKSFLSGMDLLMISGGSFSSAITYFRAVYDGTLDRAEQKALSAKIGLPFAKIQSQFRQRVTDSLARLNKARQAVGHAIDKMDARGVSPEQKLQKQIERYDQILQTVGYPTE